MNDEAARQGRPANSATEDVSSGHGGVQVRASAVLGSAARENAQRILDRAARRLRDEGYRTAPDGHLLSPLDFENFEGRDAVAESPVRWFHLAHAAILAEYERRREQEEADAA